MTSQMKTFVAVAVALILPLIVRAGDAPEMKPFKGSAELERIKSLAGVWKGKEDMGQGVQEVVVNYAVTAGGSAVVETLFPKTSHEMVSVYHDEGGKLTMTHYCMLRNQPHMKLTHTTPVSMTLSLAGRAGIANANEPHMHALTINFINADSIEHRWISYKDGKESNTVKLVLARTP